MNEKQRVAKRRKSIINIAIFWGIILGLCVVRVVYIAVWSELGLSPYNQRLNLMEDKILRGNFYDSNGVVLTQNIDEVRDYIYDGRYNTSVGYLGYGEYGLEKDYAKTLLSPTYTFLGILKNLFTKEKFVGHDVYLTLDNELQEVVEKAFAKNRGAAVVIEPKTGQVKAMFSAPAFNPNTANLEVVRNREDNPLLNRATQGLYPPGSIFKILPAYGIMEKFPETYQDIVYNCTGEIIIDGEVIKCYDHTAHGMMNLSEAFKYSCNTYFINLRNYISYKELSSIAKQFLFDTKLPTKILVKPSRFDKNDENVFSQALTYMGQGKTLVTPFHMAMIASVIANEGVLMEPYLVDHIAGKKRNTPKEVDSIFDTAMATNLQNLMIGVVNGGTGRALSGIPATVGIKTGTAENGNGDAHSWVLGFAQDREDYIAFAVVVENLEGEAVGIVEDIVVNFLENNRN
ncbi:penicillin-binding transpeptidase domain-containing protein [Candidatus Epulonipiscium viviparus]|uniref:penicillin-binding transpeptidase domain-containing protein n=1 Tax=Candidatus Epulonipiscium viviparus TaxID=420336 RepID=UPI00069091E1|nr:penicillin-binding transpeptidase domain-containing protein [Candidatus Epulopiscium viviparus]